MDMSLEQATLRRRIQWLTWVVIIGLVISGLTAIPITTELNWLSGVIPADSEQGVWLEKVRAAVQSVDRQYPFLFYGTDWLAFGHFVIAVAFFGVLRHPVRNRWLFDFGLIACGMVIPYALIMGELRGIPVWWRLIDCLFGVMGAVPMYFARRFSIQLERFGH